MEVSITVRALKEFEQRVANISSYEEQAWKYASRKKNDKVPVVLDDMTPEVLNHLRDVMKEHDEDDVRKVSRLINTLKDPANRKVTSLAGAGGLEGMLREYLKAQAHPWLFSLHSDQRGVAFLPTDVTLIREQRHRLIDESVQLTLCYNIKGGFVDHTCTFTKRDLHKTVPEILREHNLLVPDDDMIADYQKVHERYKKYSSMHGEQFWCQGMATEASERHRWWTSNEHNLTVFGQPSKAVMDIDVISDRHTRQQGRSTYLSYIFGSDRPVPTHPVLPLFSLVHHVTVWVNVANTKPYKYEEGLTEKLVLPKSHTRLISALVHNLDALRIENQAEGRSRTIRAKASSSIILALGPAGTGKTLTAEVYAEEIKRPLYEVQSGHIGSEPSEIEENLIKILARSLRLRMPLLINEADVFIKERGDDPIQNQIVAIFLRLLEYHTGLVFLTTNRTDIDKAILSRCLARIKYHLPAPAERLRLWRLMLAEFNVKLPETDIKKAVLTFPHIAGRDIQQLVLLTNRVCLAEGVEFSLDELRHNALFQDIPALTEEELAAEIAKRKAAKNESGS